MQSVARVLRLLPLSGSDTGLGCLFSGAGFRRHALSFTSASARLPLARLLPVFYPAGGGAVPGRPSGTV